MGVVLPFRRPAPRVSRARPAYPVDDPYWLPDALNLRAVEPREGYPPLRRPDDDAP